MRKSPQVPWSRSCARLRAEVHGNPAGTAAIGLCSAAWQVLLCRVAAWIGRGSRSPARDVLMAESATPEAQGRAFGMERAGDAARAVLGPLLAMVLLARGVEPRHLVFASLVPVDGFGGICSGSSPSAPVRGPAAAVALYVLHNAVSAGAAFPIGILADRLGHRRVIVGGYMLATATTLAFAILPPTPFWLVLLFVCSGCHQRHRGHGVERPRRDTVVADAGSGVGPGRGRRVPGAGRRDDRRHGGPSHGSHPVVKPSPLSRLSVCRHGARGLFPGAGCGRRTLVQ